MTDNPLASMFGGKDGAMDAMGGHWGPRDPQRWTNGNPDRTRLLAALHTLRRRIAALPPKCNIPALEEMAQILAACWAGEFGTDTRLYIEALRALKTQTAVLKPDDRPNDRQAGP